MEYRLLAINHNLQISQSYICIILYNDIENKLMNQSLLLSAHVSNACILTIKNQQVIHPQVFRHNSGTIVYVTGLYSFANGMECIIRAFPLAGLQNDHSLPLCNSDSLCIPEEEPN